MGGRGVGSDQERRLGTDGARQARLDAAADRRYLAQPVQAQPARSLTIWWI